MTPRVAGLQPLAARQTRLDLEVRLETLAEVSTWVAGAQALADSEMAELVVVEAGAVTLTHSLGVQAAVEVGPEQTLLVSGTLAAPLALERLRLQRLELLLGRSHGHPKAAEAHSWALALQASLDLQWSRR